MHKFDNSDLDIPVSARPRMKTFEDGAKVQIKEPSSKIATDAMTVHFRSNIL